MFFSTKAKVLVVDDSVTTMQMIINNLKQAGITDIEKATDGNEGVTRAMAMAEELDIIIMDWNMPNLQGVDAIMKIRELGNEVPIIMTIPNKNEGIEALKAGANAFVNLETEEIKNKIYEILKK